MFSLSNLPSLVISAACALIALSVHEASHAYAAYKLGDNTAKDLGRLTINPLKHLDPFGVICMMLFHFGWARPVPINPRNFKNPRVGFALSALAGPLSNIILAIFSALFFLVGLQFIPTTEDAFLYAVIENSLLFLQTFTLLNLGLGVFNLIPLPPFDGSRIINLILPPRAYFKIMQYERYIYWGVIAWLLIGPSVSSTLLSLPFVAASPALSVIASLFSLSDLISAAITGLYSLIIRFWGLLPFITII